MDYERKQELDFLLRIGTHIKLHAEHDVDNVEYYDYFTLRELVDAEVFDFVYMERGQGIILEAKKHIKIAKPNTLFEYEDFEEGRTFKMNSNPIIEETFADLA